MLGSRLCLQLLLGWALLLGQPVCGAEEEFEEPPSLLEEEEEEDLEEPIAPLEEEEEEITSEELEERVREDERLMEQDTELLERLTDRFSAMAMDFYNKGTYGPLYKLLDEDRNLTFKKAIGTMAYLRLFLAKTNCTTDVLQYRHRWDYLDDMFLLRESPFSELRPCTLPPLLERETLDCTFDVFLNERSYWETVMGYRCEPLEIYDSAEVYDSMEE